MILGKQATIPPAPASPPALLSLQLPSPHPLHAAHDQSIRKKFIGRTSQVDAALLIADLNANDASLLPFTIDHLGGLGHFTHSFLFGPNPAPPFSAPPRKTSLDVPPRLSPLPCLLCLPTRSPCSQQPSRSSFSSMACTDEEHASKRPYTLYEFPLPLGSPIIISQHILGPYYSPLQSPYLS